MQETWNHSDQDKICCKRSRGLHQKRIERQEIYLSRWANEILSDATDKIYTPTLLMNKKRFAEFSNYLEGSTQRIISRYPDSRYFVNDEETQILGRFPELASVQPKRQPSQTSVIEYTLTSSLNKERRKSYWGVENEIKRNTPEECVDSVNLLSKAIGNAHKDVFVLLIIAR